MREREAFKFDYNVAPFGGARTVVGLLQSAGTNVDTAPLPCRRRGSVDWTASLNGHRRVKTLTEGGPSRHG